jgi:hypothetical protein
MSAPEAVRVIARYRLTEPATLSEAVLSDLLHSIITAPLSGGDSPEAGGVTMTDRRKSYARSPDEPASWPVTGEVLGRTKMWQAGCTTCDYQTQYRQHDSAR